MLRLNLKVLVNTSKITIQKKKPYVKSSKLIGSYSGEKKYVLHTPKCFKPFAGEVSDIRRSSDVDKANGLIAETMKCFGNSAHVDCITNKELSYIRVYNLWQYQYKKNPRFKDIQRLCGEKYEFVSPK